MEVDREKVKEKKRMERQRKRKRKEEETCKKARGMIGIGPVRKETKEHFANITEDENEGRILAVKEMLSYHLDFNEEEIKALDIQETKEGSDRIIYFGASSEDLIR